MKLIIDIPEELYNRLMSDESICDDVDCYKASGYVCEGTPIPDNATNGDVVEKVFSKDVYSTLIRMMYSSCCEKLKDWWNAPYQKGGKE